MARISDLIYKDMVNKDLAYPGIYMAELMQDVNGNIKVYVPSVMNKPTTSELKFLPEAVWCAYNLESCDIANAEKPMWVMFEAGDVKRPVIVSYTVIGGAEGSSGSNTGSSSTTSTTYTSVSGGNWITKWTCTVYGGEGDDNGICGWNGINYNTISGCHVAIPMSCITGTDSNFPEFSRGYGTVLEVRNPDNGNTVVAVVADCGNFGPNGTTDNVTAALDLPPNTQRALGIFTSHSIEYRVIGYIDSWNGEQLSLSDFITNTTSSSGATNIITEAQKYLGVPYVWGGSSPNGFDCSGFVQYVYAQCGKNIPRVAADQYHQSNKVSRDQLQPGDLVFFTGSDGSSSNPGHVGIYIGNNEFIHSPAPGKVVTITSLNSSYYTSSYVGAGRY